MGKGYSIFDNVDICQYSSAFQTILLTQRQFDKLKKIDLF